MRACEHCASTNLRLFTPSHCADRAAVLLCMECRRLTIVPPRGAFSGELASRLAPVASVRAA